MSKHVEALVRKGRIEADREKKHNVRLTESGWTAIGRTHARQGVPVIGSIAAGVPILARSSSGGGATPAITTCAWFSVTDRSQPPLPPPVRFRTPHPPLPPKPAVSRPSAPEAPKVERNLVLGATLTASIYPGKTADLAKSGSGDWFAGQRFPQWLAMDFGSAIAFDYLSFTGIQISSDGVLWTNLVEIDHQRKPWVWNGCFAPITARYLRLVPVPPSWDVHIRHIVVAELAKPLLDADDKPVPVLHPCGPLSGLESLPPAAGILLISCGFMGIGFGFTVASINTLAEDLFPQKVDRAILVLNALLGLGTALAPIVIAVFVGLGIWWGLPVIVGVLTLGLFLFRLRLELTTGKATPQQHARHGK